MQQRTQTVGCDVSMAGSGSISMQSVTAMTSTQQRIYVDRVEKDSRQTGQTVGQACTDSTPVCLLNNAHPGNQHTRLFSFIQ